ncbi:uncharacterized protein LOC118180814 [Stegodyphus dumicola]|uniref:uncharacterized protein LOC118180814 n=1 Tax=Stegodyphus dumicola TaxID=202533 RepID=UPI0015B27595|nr:uncharacterized protein LOC118180814 [Stegodyphus dumicola]
MKELCLVFVAGLLLVLLLSCECGSQKCKKKMEKFSIIPQFADDVDSTDVEITYPPDETLKCGNKISIVNTALLPTIKHDVTGKCENVTVTLFGFGPFPVLGVPFAHWLVYNIPASALANGYRGIEGDTEIKYLPPLAPNIKNRYTFFIYCQKEFIQPGNKLLANVDRLNYQPKSVANAHNLGNPILAQFLILVLANTGPFEDPL